MRYVEGLNRQQTLLFPELLDDYVADDNPVRFIDAFVDSLDLNKLGFTHATTFQTGRKPYAPADLLKLYVYGYLNRTRSSRRLEKETYRNNEVIWLLKKLKPDFKTIADFRKDNGKAIQKVCREFIMLCKKLELFGGELIAIDGSKFNAVNHNSRCYTKNKLQKMLQEIDEKIAKYLSTLDNQDQNESEIKPTTLNQFQEQIKNIEQHKVNLEQLLQQLEESGETQVSLTDPDSRMMKTKKATDVSYNAQIATDAKHKLIADFEVTNDPNDLNQLSNMAQKAKHTLGVEQINCTADKGYHKDIEIKKCEQENITCFIPAPAKSQNKKKGLYTDKDFKYDAENDCYICPENEKLLLRSQVKKHNKQTKVYRCKACKTCAKQSKCTTNKRDGRSIYRWIHQEVIEQVAKRVQENPEIINKRKALVEHPFGTIKQWMDQKYFLTRGIEKVSTEFSLSVLAYNIKRVLNIISINDLIKMVQKEASLGRNLVFNYFVLFFYAKKMTAIYSPCIL